MAKINFDPVMLKDILRKSPDTRLNNQVDFSMDDVPAEKLDILKQAYLELLLSQNTDFAPLGKRLGQFATMYLPRVQAAIGAVVPDDPEDPELPPEPDEPEQPGEPPQEPEELDETALSEDE